MGQGWYSNEVATSYILYIVSLAVFKLKFLTIHFQYIHDPVYCFALQLICSSWGLRRSLTASFFFVFFLAVRRYKPKPAWCFMRIIDREERIDKLRRGSAVNEAGYSGDPGGITTHSSLISCKAAWNPMLSALINVLSRSLSLSSSDSSALALTLFSGPDECRANQ